MRRGDEHATEEGLAVCAEPGRVLDLRFESACRLLNIADTHLTALDLCVKGGHALVIEWDATADEDVEHNTQRPDVDFRSCIRSCIE